MNGLFGLKDGKAANMFVGLEENGRAHGNFVLIQIML